MKQNLIGESPAFLAVLDQVSKLAPIERPVLIIGERGTGKELIAQRLHYLSRRWDNPLISLNCATLSEGLIDSELFGHESGSFTGSKGKHKGRFERAEGGTLFLDELATAPLLVQEKLLRVIEYGEYERVGGHTLLSADVRLVCATNANLPEMAQLGQFRADLLDRLAFDVILLPPLRERQEDILLLAEHYAMKMCRELQLDYFAGFTDQAIEQLLTHAWPGNVRELKNVVERAIYRHGIATTPIDELNFNPFQADWQTADSTLNPTANPMHNPAFKTATGSDSSEAEASGKGASEATPARFSLPLDYKQWQESQDIQLLTQALEQSKFNQRQAAELLGLSYHQLRGMVRKYGLVGQA